MSLCLYVFVALFISFNLHLPVAAPEKIEAIYGRSPYINQIMVHGESLMSCLVSLIVPDERNLMKWAVKQVSMQRMPDLAHACTRIHTCAHART